MWVMSMVMLQIYLSAKSCNRVTTAAPRESSSVVSEVVQVARMMISGMTVESSSKHIGPETAKA